MTAGKRKRRGSYRRKTFLGKLSPEAGFAVLVVVHLDPNHDSDTR